MVGLAIGLFIVATSMTLLTANLREHRALLVESRLVQDLRTAADLVARDLRRAGYWGDAGAGIRQPGAASAPANPYAAVTPSGGPASDAATFRFSRDAVENHIVDGNEQFGFRLRHGALELMLGSGNWQAVTDPAALVVSDFSVTPAVQQTALDAFCATPCPAGAACPQQQVRAFSFSLTAHAAADAAVVRTVRQAVRLRNDRVDGACPS